MIININYNNNNCEDYLESHILEMKMIENAWGILSSNIKSLNGLLN